MLRHAQSRIPLLAIVPMLVTLLAIQLSGCDGAPTTAPAFPTTALTIKGQRFVMELAATEKQREQGLMHRQALPDDHGMLFLFARTHTLSFWMANTPLPLDLLYLDENGKIVDILSLKPNDTTPVPSSAPSRYAIELKRGTADKLDLHVGDTIALPADLPKPEPDPE